MHSRLPSLRSNGPGPFPPAPCPQVQEPPFGYPTPLDKVKEVIRHRPLHNDSNAAVGPRCAMPLSRPATGLAARRQYLFPPPRVGNRKTKQLRSHFASGQWER